MNKRGNMRTMGHRAVIGFLFLRLADAAAAATTVLDIGDGLTIH